ncbi:hypothetical protein CYMTET_15601 [Cymbomonas tetramitiformis]|uniref:Uncharacterized protein n=1 Tax=Cymbomonas tetramitiformis TaxID=36881 RepID=A0AAE0GE80_9CHLO|nr:hypothetical protein CYMTET_15601 [Cymbomonas tetramitiformis]
MEPSPDIEHTPSESVTEPGTVETEVSLASPAGTLDLVTAEEEDCPMSPEAPVNTARVLGGSVPDVETLTVSVPKVNSEEELEYAAMMDPQSARKNSTSTIASAYESEASSAVQSRTGYCSWCFNAGQHIKTREQAFAGISRAVYTCVKCSRRTLPCRSIGCGALARGMQGWDEEHCYVHRGIIRCWTDWTGISQLQPIGRCSWCLKSTMHEVVNIPASAAVQAGGRAAMAAAAALINPVAGGVVAVASMVSIDTVRTFQCTGCYKMTSHCTSCNEAFMRGGEKTCLLCQELIDSWEAAESRSEEGLSAVCSCCLEFTQHLMRAGGKHGVGGCSGSQYECTLCSNLTTPCSECLPESGELKLVMRPWKDSRCKRCLMEAKSPGSWEVLCNKRKAVDSEALKPGALHTLLHQNCTERLQAQRSGCLRPFLALVSMTQHERVALAMELGIMLSDRPEVYLNPHAEALCILNAPQRGLKTCAARLSSKTFSAGLQTRDLDWLQILVRVLLELDALPTSIRALLINQAFGSSGSLKVSRGTGSAEMVAVEVALLEYALKVQSAQLSEAQSDIAHRLTNAAIATNLVEGVLRDPEMASMPLMVMQAALLRMPWYTSSMDMLELSDPRPRRSQLLHSMPGPLT